MEFAVACRLSGLPEVWKEITHMGEVVRFKSEPEAAHWMKLRFPHTLQGVPHRCDVFHGLQPLKVVPLH